MSEPESWVYVLHFDRPHPNGRHPQHYVGVAKDPAIRCMEHARGNHGKGGALPRSFAELKIAFRIVLLMGFDTANAAFEYERHIKRSKNHARWCGICQSDEAFTHRRNQ